MTEDPRKDDPARQGPAIFRGDDPALAAPAPSPAEAPPPVEEDEAPTPAMTRAAQLAAGKPSGWAGRLLWSAAAGLVTLALSVWAWDFVTGLLERFPLLGWLAAALIAAIGVALAAVALRETAALARLGKVDDLRRKAEAALRGGDRAEALAAVEGLETLYSSRPDLDWARDRVAQRRGDLVDADSLVTLAEREYLAGLDAQARAAVESASRQVAGATAFMPVAVVDVIAALGLNMRMIRRIAEIYGGRAGTLGSWRLLKEVASHLVATGAVAVGDDLLGPVLGGGALAKISRRFGEGLVNGALTARVGVAAIEVCRPLPFHALPRPRARSLVARALAGFVPSR